MHASSPPMIVERGRGRTLVWLGVAVAVVCVGLLFFFNPAEHPVYPRCFLKMTTGLDCPGCGGLRATHQLLHGNLAQAFALNPLFVVALPFASFLLGRLLVERFTERRFPRGLRASSLAWAGAAVVIAFGVLRNLPWRMWLQG